MLSGRFYLGYRGLNPINHDYQAGVAILEFDGEKFFGRDTGLILWDGKLLSNENDVIEFNLTMKIEKGLDAFGLFDSRWFHGEEKGDYNSRHFSSIKIPLSVISGREKFYFVPELNKEVKFIKFSK